MVKVLAQAGQSLADVYDVEGSIAGIEQLVTTDLPIVHEMGGTVFSERLSGSVRRLPTGDILQNATFDVTLSDLPLGVVRILSVLVMMNTANRIDRAQVSLRSSVSGREVPIYIWDDTLGQQTNFRTVENGSAVGNQFAMTMDQQRPVLPNVLINQGIAADITDEIVLRGLANGFGAGTVECIALVQIAHTNIGGVGNSSAGLPVPSW